ncbi:MAG: AtpZ/AtpI family protein [Rubripirellula sp.]
MNKPQRSKRALPPDGVRSSGTRKVERSKAGVAGSERLGRPVGFRYAALGTELAAYTLVFAGVGFAVDKARGNQKYYATAFCTLIGFAFGMFRFVSEVQRGTGGKP